MSNDTEEVISVKDNVNLDRSVRGGFQPDPSQNEPKVCKPVVSKIEKGSKLAAEAETMGNRHFTKHI